MNTSQFKSQQIGILKMNKQNKEIQLGVKLRIIHNKIDKYFDRRKNGTDFCVPKGQGMTLHYLMLHQNEEVYQKDIESHFGISGATATNILKGLEKNNLIIRVPSEKDGRLKKIVATEKAYKRQVHIDDSINMLEESLIKDFSTEELDSLFRMVDKIIQNIDDLILYIDNCDKNEE